ncbi:MULTISPECIES: hypothetical protein [Pyrobaculum]|uniref:Uncharacterized protein n=2 Tax=Pyrobaculum arsenaticum TaxID=121277 RepID=A4WH50_PYRAR|nr:hypothetical protein [Pyrobaculum arsenaticum]ABP49717.1 conserved hypothetical protein [Pyrobaculum arsenaticum DSM 13514]MCY0890849.1 hypothetical protein [Pyrobaculum arsenaticum]NYR15703.1 hypothetical protein [Pyrobaculum arsenaticum]
MDELKFSVRKSDFDRFAEKLGVSPEEILTALKAEVVKVGPGFRYLIDMENFFYYVLSRLHTQKKEAPPRQQAASPERFEEVLNRAIDSLAGASGYAKLVEVKNAVTRELGIEEEEFVRRLQDLIQTKKGAYILLEGGDLKIQIGAKKYGYIKRVVKNSLAEVVYY